MHEQHVAVAILRVLYGLAGADRDDTHLDAGLGRDHRQQVVEKPGIFSGRGRLHNDVPTALGLAAARIHHCQGGKQAERRRTGQGSENPPLHGVLPTCTLHVDPTKKQGCERMQTASST